MKNFTLYESSLRSKVAKSIILWLLCNSYVSINFIFFYIEITQTNFIILLLNTKIKYLNPILV